MFVDWVGGGVSKFEGSWAGSAQIVVVDWVGVVGWCWVLASVVVSMEEVAALKELSMSMGCVEGGQELNEKSS